MGKTVTIPARSFKIVEADVDMRKAMHGKSAQNRVCAVECLPTLAETMGVVMGSELVEVQNGKVPVNLINVHDTPLQVYKGKTLGSLHPVKHISTIRSEKQSQKV